MAFFTQIFSRSGNAFLKPTDLSTTNKMGGLESTLTLTNERLDVEPQVIFNIPYLTKNLILKAMVEVPRTPAPPRDYSYPLFQNHSSEKLNCVFMSHGGPRVIPRPFDPIVLKHLPMTKCLTHGTFGFFPYEYIRLLPEYSCITYHYPNFKVVHAFNQCIMEFP
ncbi:uncharacterized protein LOC127249381 [Andrographis paniculata]|uniref:uncharacterized protein LOC127249381 n=1 Tax=Andrographis paniculata TaxID=175694 RepID=UPI0021E859B5|nr:uncharacterized protein LOC127249381 [Andrographis paniculata]